MAFRQVRSLFPKSIDFSKSPSLTRQEFAASSDMNYIVSKFLRTGQIDFPNAARPMVDGLEYPNDFTEACNLAFEQRNEEIQSKHEQDTLEIQNESSVVPSSAGVQDGAKDGQKENSQVEQPDKAI